MELSEPEIRSRVKRRGGPKPLRMRAKFAATAWLDGDLLWREGRVVWRVAGHEMSVGPRELDAVGRELASLRRHEKAAARCCADFEAWHTRRTDQWRSARHLAAIRAPDLETLASPSRRRNPVALERLTQLLVVEASAAEPLPASPSKALFAAWPLSQEPLKRLLNDENSPLQARALAALVVGAALPLAALPGEPFLRRAARYGARFGFPLAPQLMVSLLENGERDGENGTRRIENALEQSLQNAAPFGFDAAALMTMQRVGKSAAAIAEIAECALELPDPFPPLKFALVAPQRFNAPAQRELSAAWNAARAATHAQLRPILAQIARGGEAGDLERTSRLLQHLIEAPLRALGPLKIERGRSPQRKERDLPSFENGVQKAMGVVLQIVQEVAAAPDAGARLQLLIEALPKCSVCPQAENLSPTLWASGWHSFALYQQHRVFAPLLQLAQKSGHMAREALRLDCWREMARQRQMTPELLLYALEIAASAPASVSGMLSQWGRWERHWNGVEGARASFGPILKALRDAAPAERALWLDELVSEVENSRRGVRVDLPALACFIPAMRRAKAGREVPRWALVETANALRCAAEMVVENDAETAVFQEIQSKTPGARASRPPGNSKTRSETARFRNPAGATPALRECTPAALVLSRFEWLSGEMARRWDAAIAPDADGKASDEPSWTNLNAGAALCAQLAGNDEPKFQQLMACVWRYVGYDPDFSWPEVRRGAKLARALPHFEAVLAANFARCPARCFSLLEKLGPLDHFEAARAPLQSWREKIIAAAAPISEWGFECDEALQAWLRRFQKAKCVLQEAEHLPAGVLKIAAWPQKIEREIAALQRAENLAAPQAKRLENLMARLENRAALLASMQIEMREAMQNATLEAEMRAVEAAVDNCYRVRLESLGAPKNLALDADLLNAALFSTDPEANRKWLREIVRRHGETATETETETRGDWRLGIEGNARWLASRKAQGLNLGQWLAEAPQMLAIGGGRIELRLENDPLKILQMGNYFDTCLSRGGINAFSSVANAVELNKRVVFARDARGRVVGRQLLALSSEGTLLGFHLYLSVGEADLAALRAAFGRYARDFAARCGVELGDQGEVERLFVAQWYDDGSVAWGNLAPVPKRSKIQKAQ